MNENQNPRMISVQATGCLFLYVRSKRTSLSGPSGKILPITKAKAATPTKKTRSAKGLIARARSQGSTQSMN